VAVTVEQRAPRVRCHNCGSSAVRALCHHCWRPGCTQHVRPSPRWAERLFGAEGSGPGLGNVRAWHCADCTHVRVGRWLEAGAAGLALAVIGLLVVPASLVAGLFLIIGGGTAAAWAYARVRRRSAQARADLPVPLHPKVSDVRLVERLRTCIILGEQGDYRIQVDPVDGKLTATLTFGSHDRERVEHYRGKRKLAPDREVRYVAGCLVPQGPTGISELSEDPVVRVDGIAGDVPAFRPEDPPASSRRDVSLEYRLSAAPDIDAGPLWITPSITPESERHVLELDIQWTEFGPDDGEPLNLDVIELLKITVPANWGGVQGANRGLVMVSPPDDAPDGTQVFRALEWRRLSPDKAEREARQLTIAVQFEEPIAVKDGLSGRLEATMKGTLSGVDGVRMYNALGARRAVSSTPSVKTRVEADFTLSLASIRYQAVRVFPDRADTGSSRDGYAVESDVIPDDETVIALTNALSEEDFYVKHVTENPPRSGGRADVVHRYWDIAGRSYQGVYPVDFQLVLTGEEVHRGDVRPESGSTKIQIVLRGAYTNDDMYAHVKDEWTRLRAVTEEALKGHPPPGRGSAEV
jgi:hypothetical protein